MGSLTISKPLFCIAHRGGIGNHTENTLESIKECLQLDIDAIEIDTWNIGGELLITHDRRLGRTLPGQGRLIDQNPEHIRNLELSCGNKIASLIDILELVQNKVCLNIELKGPNCSKTVAQTLQTFIEDNQLSYENYVVSSFDQRQLYEFKQLLPKIHRGVLAEGIPLHYAQCCDELGAFSFHPSIDFINQELVDDAHKRGLKVWAYTANEVDDLCHLADLGVDGAFTDYPARLIQMNLQTSNNKYMGKLFI